MTGDQRGLAAHRAQLRRLVVEADKALHANPDHVDRDEVASRCRQLLDQHAASRLTRLQDDPGGAP